MCWGERKTSKKKKGMLSLPAKDHQVVQLLERKHNIQVFQRQHRKCPGYRDEGTRSNCNETQRGSPEPELLTSELPSVQPERKPIIYCHD